MTATKDDIKELHKKIDEHKKETKSEFSELVSSMKELPIAITKLTIDLREMLVEFRGQKEATGRLSKEIQELKKDQGELSTKVTIIHTTQESLSKSRDQLAGFGSKLLIIVLGALAGAISLLSGIILYKDAVI